jgi:hypothetical protein
VPIRAFIGQGHHFDDEAIRVMGLAFECARSALHIQSSDDPLSAKVATKIIEFAQTGERDPEKLCDFAVDGLKTPPAA